MNLFWICKTEPFRLHSNSKNPLLLGQQNHKIMKSIFTLLFVIFSTVVFAQKVDLEKLDAYFEKTAKDWGIPGMIMSIPITVFIKIILEQFPNTKVIASLLAGNDSRTFK